MNLSKLNFLKLLFKCLFMLTLWSQLSGCAWLDQRLRLAAFRPTPASEQDKQRLPKDIQVYLVPAQPSPSEEPNDNRGNERLSFLYFPAEQQAQAPTVLYLHGVFRNALQNVPKIQAIRDAGFNVLALDYRGWGFSTYTLPSEQSVMADALVGLAELVKREARPSQRIVFGHSMGGAVATALVANSNLSGPVSVGGLVLESTFASVRALTLQAKWYGFIALPFVANTFDSTKLIGKVNQPIWMMHGAKDNVVPIDQGRVLAQAAPHGTPFEVFENAQHSDLHRADEIKYRVVWRSIRERISAKQ
jgi:uncharacterized protein